MKKVFEDVISKFSTDEMLERLKKGDLHNKMNHFTTFILALEARGFFGEGLQVQMIHGGSCFKEERGESFSKLIHEELQISIGKFQQISLDRWDHEEKYHSIGNKNLKSKTKK